MAVVTVVAGLMGEAEEVAEDHTGVVAQFIKAAADLEEVAHFMGVAAELGEVGPRFIEVAADLGALEVMEELLKASEVPVGRVEFKPEGQFRWARKGTVVG